MNKTTLSVAFLALAAAPQIALAEFKLGGEVYLGYGDAGDDEEGALTTASAYVTDTLDIEGVGKLEYKLQANYRSNQEDIGYIDDNIGDFSVSLDMGSGGKLGMSTFGTLGQKPWADGEIMNRGSVGVFPSVPRRFRAIGDKTLLVIDGETHKVQEDFRITYENRFGSTGLEIVADPFQLYGPVSGDHVVTADGTDRPTAQIKLTQPTPFGIYSIMGNDLGDIQAEVAYPVPDSGLVVIGSYAANGDDADLFNSDVTAVYHTDNAGWFKGFFATYTRGSFDLEKFVLSTEWGTDDFRLLIGADSDEDYAAEASYNLGKNAVVYAGWDSGHAFLNGFDDAYEPPVFAPERDGSYEFGIKITF